MFVCDSWNFEYKYVICTWYVYCFVEFVFNFFSTIRSTM